MVVKNREKKFEGILCAARDEIARRGMKFTMDSVARRLRISKKTLYQSVSSRQELIEKVVDSALESIAENEARIFQDPELSLNERYLCSLELYRSALQPFDKETMLEMMQYYPELWEKFERLRLAEWRSAIERMQLSISQGEFARINMELLINGVLLELLMPGKQSNAGSVTVDLLIKQLTDLFREADTVDGAKTSNS